ncbi:hypothetical protein ACKGJO_11150 [Gracilimonas sp. Q87]|uniref:hypothetical protein n=1 Tax=Gracilimonas sp. Q87 TaxID=3384766 RepID=UPI0039845FB0
MDYKKISILIVLLTGMGWLNTANAQQTNEAEIHLFARYVEGDGIEMRWFSDNNEVMRRGTESGFIVERRVAGTGPFQTVQTVQPLDESQTEQLIQTTVGEGDRADRLRVVTELRDSDTDHLPGEIDFQNRIEDLVNRKSAEDFRTMTFMLSSFEDSLAARVLGLSASDTNVMPGQTYEYRARLVSSGGLNVTSVVTEITATEQTEDYEVPILVNEGDGELSFIWQQPENSVGMYVQRSFSENGPFEPLNEVIELNLRGKQFDGPQRGTFFDKELNNYRNYHYRFYGQNVFGERVLFGEASGTPRDLTPPREPLLLQPKHESEDTVRVTWEMPGTVDNDLAGFAVLRGDGSSEEFVRLHPDLTDPNLREWIDLDFNRDLDTYYAIQAVDTAGNVSTSAVLPVSYIRFNPPVKPEIGQATIGDDGSVEIIISPDPEDAVDGYKIFMANDPEHEFSVVKEMFGDSLITSGSRTIVRDTVMLNTLTRNVYYKIRAYDVHFNESEESDVIALERPDIVPPPRPVFKNVEIGSTDVNFEIALPSVIDFQTATLYRRSGPASDWQPIQTFREKTEIARYTDRGLEPGATYFYRLQAEDQSGLLSDFSNPVQVKTVNRRSVSVAENLSAQSGDRGTVIRWAYPGDDLDEVFFVIYRRSGEEGLRQVGRSDNTTFTDRRVRAGRYEYRVRVFRKDGNQSLLSDTAVVTVGN